METSLYIGGLSAGTAALNSGVTALMRKGLGRTISYTPGIIAGAASGATFMIGTFLEENIAQSLNMEEEKYACLQLGARLLLGGLLPKLFCRQISLTHACALSVLSYTSSTLLTLFLINTTE